MFTISGIRECHAFVSSVTLISSVDMQWRKWGSNHLTWCHYGGISNYMIVLSIQQVVCITLCSPDVKWRKDMPLRCPILVFGPKTGFHWQRAVREITYWKLRSLATCIHIRKCAAPCIKAILRLCKKWITLQSMSLILSPNSKNPHFIDNVSHCQHYCRFFFYSFDIIPHFTDLMGMYIYKEKGVGRSVITHRVCI